MNSFCFLSAILICFKNHPGITGRKGGGRRTAGEWATSDSLSWTDWGRQVEKYLECRAWGGGGVHKESEYLADIQVVTINPICRDFRVLSVQSLVFFLLLTMRFKRKPSWHSGQWLQSVGCCGVAKGVRGGRIRGGGCWSSWWSDRQSDLSEKAEGCWQVLIA